MMQYCIMHMWSATINLYSSFLKVSNSKGEIVCENGLTFGVTRVTK